MALLYGKDTLEERMKKDTMSNPTFVCTNQKYSAYDSPRHVESEDRQGRKEDDENRKYHAKGGPIDMDQNEEDDSRADHAMGGVAKLRRGEYHGSVKNNDE